MDYKVKSSTYVPSFRTLEYLLGSSRSGHPKLSATLASWAHVAPDQHPPFDLHDTMEQDDTALIALITALHLSDLQQLKKTHKDGNTKEEQCAFQFYEEELRASQSFLQDKRMALSLDRATRQDRVLLEQLEAVEEVARRDHDLALALSGGRSTPGSARGARSTTTTTTSPRSTSGSITPSTAPSSRVFTSLPTKPTPVARLQLVECVICNDRIPPQQAIQVPCKHRHYYDRDCLRSLFLAATRDESLFPPRCDNTPIPLALARPILTAAQLDTFRTKSVEFSTPNRLYCSRSTCSEFLGSSSKDKAAKDCPKCGTKTCIACKAPWHGLFGLCGAGKDEEAVEVLRREFNFQRCPGCQRMVELQVGCYHMCVTFPNLLSARSGALI